VGCKNIVGIIKIKTVGKIKNRGPKDDVYYPNIIKGHAAAAVC
jgi:hypothetical protein